MAAVDRCQGAPTTQADVGHRNRDDNNKILIYADVVELVDSLDLGSNAQACRFESCHPHQSIQTRTFYQSVKGLGFPLIDKKCNDMYNEIY